MVDKKETGQEELTTEAMPESQETVNVSEGESSGVASAEPVQLQIGDLQTLAQILNLASRRGAFEASEMSAVGKTFDKLKAFLSYVATVQNTNTETEEGSTESTEE